jgi:hypothetical protein
MTSCAKEIKADDLNAGDKALLTELESRADAQQRVLAREVAELKKKFNQ